MNKTGRQRERESGGSEHSKWQIEARVSLSPNVFPSVCLSLKLGQEVGLFVTSTCEPQPSMLCSPEGGQGGSGQAWAVTSV